MGFEPTTPALQSIHVPWMMKARMGKAGVIAVESDSSSSSHLPNSKVAAAKSHVVTLAANHHFQRVV